MTHRITTAICAALLLAAPAYAATEHFHADMLGPSEVPANTSAGTGSVDATLDTATKKLDYVVTWSGLTGPATMAHIHGPAPAGKNAGVIVPLGEAPTSPIRGSAPLTDAQIKALENAQYYVNVHTDAHKGGEIRGQLLPAS
jgi:hypothetical protein